jgi:hypothetical protein
MTDLFRLALDAAGYYDNEATEQNVRDCLLDYIDAGVFRNLDSEDVDDLTPQEMASGLIKYCR